MLQCAPRVGTACGTWLPDGWTSVQPMVVWGTSHLTPALPAGGLWEVHAALSNGQSCPSHCVVAFGVRSKTDPSAWTQILQLTGVMGSASPLWIAGARVFWRVRVEQVLPWGLD